MNNRGLEYLLTYEKRLRAGLVPSGGWGRGRGEFSWCTWQSEEPKNMQLGSSWWHSITVQEEIQEFLCKREKKNNNNLLCE